MGRTIDAQRAAGRLAQRRLGGCTDAAGRLPCGSVALAALGAGAPGAIAGLGPPAARHGRGGRGRAGGGHVGATPGTGSALHRVGVVRTGGEPAWLVLAPQSRCARGAARHARGQFGVLRGDGGAWPVATQSGPAHVAGPGGRHRGHAGVLPRTGVPRALAQGPQQLRGEVRSAVAADRWLRALRTAGHRSRRPGCAPRHDDRVECRHARAVLRLDFHHAAR